MFAKYRGWPMVVGVLVVTLAAGAAEKEGVNTAAPEAAAKARVTADAVAVQKLSLARGLIHYGRKNKVPEALVTAARILGETSTVELSDRPTHEKDPRAGKAESKARPETDDSPKALLEEAKKMSGNSPAIVALANAVELKRGAVGGPRVTTEVVQGYSSDIFKVRFRGDEVARVAVSGDGDTRLDLYIYDENGHLITSQVGPGDDCLASWTPRWTGVFIIKVVNRGGIANRYVIATN
jgi:hypothetical protein